MLYGKIVEICTDINESNKYPYGLIEYIYNDENNRIRFIDRSCADGFKVKDFSIDDDVQFKVSFDKKVPEKMLVIGLSKATEKHIPKEVFDLDEWAFIDHTKIESLTEVALKEKWYFGKQQYYCKDSEPICGKYPILEQYLNHTYKRLCYEQKVVISEIDENYAAFNTGLVDKRYQDIYALFERNNNSNGPQPWKLIDFVVKGEDNGKILTEYFDTMPLRAVYFSNISEVILDNTALKENKNKIDIDYEHIIVENIDRFPISYIIKYLPRTLRFESVSLDDLSDNAAPADSEAFYKELQDIIRRDKSVILFMLQSFKSAVEMATRRTLWNYKTAVPMYYPPKHSMSILLPICLNEEGITDVALVLQKMKSSRYQGQTILTLEMAYSNSRLITRPDSDWLVTGNEDA